MRISSLLILVSVLLSCSEKPEENAPIGDVFAQYHEESLKFFPLNATMAGDNRYNDHLPNNLTQSFNSELREFYLKYNELLTQYDPESLSEKERMSMEVLKWELDIGLRGLEFPVELMPINQIFALHLFIGQLASGSSMQPFENATDYDNWLSRIDGFKAWCDTAVSNMRKGMVQGYTLPKSLTVKVVPQLRSFTTEPVEENLFYTPVKNFPESVGPDDQSRLQKSYYEMVEKTIIPTFTEMADFMENEYLPAGRESSGFDALPNGTEMYNHFIRFFTTTDMTADEIFNLGNSEVQRIRGEMEKVMDEVGFEGDLKAFFDHVRQRPELMPYSDPQEVIDNFNEIHTRMMPNIERLFDKKPETAFEVRRTEAFREASASAEYNPGAKDGSRPGIFYVPIPEVSRYNTVSDESLFLHEAIPGHHFQISLQMEDETLPEFRKTLWYSAYGEGWALYSESLGKELGLYDDPYQYFGMLSQEMHRAIRLVVDAGMHSKGWTREQAIQFSLENEAASEAGIIAEIERYMAGGGQALSYKIGQLKIRELRSRAEDALGENFDIREFHNKVLETGCVPLKLLEDKIDRWIVEQSTP